MSLDGQGWLHRRWRRRQPSANDARRCQRNPSWTKRSTDDTRAVTGSLPRRSASASSRTASSWPWAIVRCGTMSSNCPPKGGVSGHRSAIASVSRAERCVRLGGEIQNPGEPPAVLEPGLEGPVMPDYLTDGSAGVPVDAAFVEEREEHGDMRRDTPTSRGVQPVPPCSNSRFRLRNPHDQSRPPCLRFAGIVTRHLTCLSAGPEGSDRLSPRAVEPTASSPSRGWGQISLPDQVQKVAQWGRIPLGGFQRASQHVITPVLRRA